MEINSENIQKLGWIPIYIGSGADIYQYKEQNTSLHWRRQRKLFHIIINKQPIFNGDIKDMNELTEIMKKHNIV